jgi:hypothetical protein
MLCTAWVSSSLFANGRTAGRKAGAAVTADVLSGAADAGEELEPPRSSAGRTFLLPRSDVIVCTLPRVSLVEGHFLFLGPTAQIGRFIARRATQLCNHAGLGLGRHAMNLKELHLGPRPRAAALASARTSSSSSSFRRVGNVPEAAAKTTKLKIPRIPIPPHTSARKNPKSGIYHPNTGK